MTRYRKKPVVVEAVPYNGNYRKWPLWLRKAFIAGDILIRHDGITIHTLEGTMRASEGDWIIQGVQGEIYPCKPDIFEATYELAE